MLAGAAAAGLLVAAVVVGVALAFGGKAASSTGSVPQRGSLSNALPNAADARAEFARIPQHGVFLGSPKAPVTMVEYVDLQCPICREFESTVMPGIVRRYVRTGKLRVEARPIAFIGPDSVPARLAALAAARQNRMFDFMQIVYFNQGTENTGWLNHDFIVRAAASVPGMGVPRLLADAGSKAIKSEGSRLDSEANADRVPGTPALLVGKTGSKPTLLAASDEGTVTAAINSALR